MAQQNTFDIVSKIDHAEVVNAINQALKEVQTRFDFKGSQSNIEVEGDEFIILTSDDEYKLKSLNEILQAKLVKRSVPLKGLTYGKIEQALGGTVRQRISLQQGIPQEKAKEIVKLIKDTKLKVQASIQGDFVRVSGKDRDTLQNVISALRDKDFGIDMQFTNYRSN
jgi:cyclic-di-GMP-binding protein